MKTGTIKKASSLSNRALLVTVNISQWSGRKLDKRATETANIAHNADATAGNYHKKLLPAARELELVGTIASQARKYYYEQTLPWMSDGTRIISGQNYLKFQSEMRKIKGQFENAVKEFETAYPRLQNEAKSKLGNLYDSEEYPDNISERFGIEYSFLPLPDAKDFRVAVGDAEKRAFERKIKDIETVAMRDASQRLLDVVKSATEKLKDPKAIFRDSLLENISEIASLIPSLNISGDSKLDQLSEEAKKVIKSIDSKTVRTDSKERDKASKALKDIESRMGAFMGALK